MSSLVESEFQARNVSESQFPKDGTKTEMKDMIYLFCPVIPALKENYLFFLFRLS